MPFRIRLVLALVLCVSLIVAHASQGTAGRRLTPREIADLVQVGPGAGTSGVAGIRTTVLESPSQHRQPADAPVA